MADGTEGANFTFVLDGDADGAVGGIIAYSGVDATGGVNQNGVGTGPFDADPGVINGIASDNQLNADAITTFTANAAVIMFGWVGDNDTFASWTTTTPGALTEVMEDNNTNGADQGIGVAWATKAATGSTGAGTATVSASDPNGALLLTLKRCTATIPAQPSTITGTTYLCSGAMGNSYSVPMFQEFLIIGTSHQGVVDGVLPQDKELVQSLLRQEQPFRRH